MTCPVSPRPAFALFGILLVTTLCAARYFAAERQLVVNEAATRANFDGELPKISLAVENRSGRSAAAHVRLELLDPQGRVYFRAERDEEIKAGASTLELTLGRTAVNPDESLRELLWYRLRYSLAPAAPAEAQKPEPVEGIISVSEITPEIFELQVFAPDIARVGSRFQARALTSHPITGRPVAGVRVEGRIGNEGKHALKVSGTTDADGYAVLTFELPKAIEDRQLEINFTATRGSLRREAEVDNVLVDSIARVLLTTDKPIYQPGQMLHVRALVFDPTDHALADAKAELTVTDPEDQTVFRAPLKTSRFGVANADWQIPENTRLGDHRVRVKLNDAHESGASSTIKISRYELPTFTVSVQTDRAYYLPGQDAEVEVRADYLFGRPVTKGKVKVVRETERTWNYREQKYDIEEGEKHEGETDAAGRFVMRLDLSEAHDDLKDSDYRRFQDLRYAAYFTDVTTGRTEQRRFDVRVTKGEIHIYIIADRPQTENFPLEFYVSASYADGRPAQCEIAISEVFEPEDKQRAPREVPLRSVRTNSYGVAKISRLALPHNDDRNSNPQLGFFARDTQGRTGRHTEEMQVNDSPAVRIATDKALYRTGEPIKVALESSVPDARLVVEAVNDGKTISSQVVQLRAGAGTAVVPYQAGVRGEVRLTAYANFLNDDGKQNTSHGSRTVLYPHDREMKIDAPTLRNEYRPGEQAVTEIRTRAANGRPVEAVIGAVVFDKAVEERARTDREFGGSLYGAYYNFYYSGNSVGGLTRKDIEQADLTKPLPAGFDLVAEIILSGEGQGVINVGNSEYDKDQRKIFAAKIEAQLKPVRDSLSIQYSRSGAYPTDAATLRRMLAPAGINPDELRDPWGTPYRIEFVTRREDDEMRVTSAGADKRFDTNDDFVVTTIQRQYFRFTGEAINRAIERYRVRTGDYIRDPAMLKAELRRDGIDFDALRDPWGGGYRITFGKTWANFSAMIWSGGANGHFDAAGAAENDDFTIWTAQIDFTSGLRARVGKALEDHFRATSRFPSNEEEFNDALRRAAIDPESLRDPWGNKYYTTFKVESSYGDRVTIQSYATYGQQPQSRTTVKPVTRKHQVIALRSAGEDRRQGTADDFDAVSFSQLIVEQASDEQSEKNQAPPAAPVILPGSTGAIKGIVTDPTGAALSGARVSATHKTTSLSYATVSNSEGQYLLKNLPAGSYDVQFEAAGFKKLVMSDVPVRSSSLTTLNATVEVGGVSEAVAITAEPVRMRTELSSSATVVGRQVLNLVALKPGVALVTKSGPETPRLREYFPETLLWQPSIETDTRGRAQLKFKLADNITTWKLALIGSTVDGQIGIAEREIRAFQPFFAELDPPKVLTEGDEISLPVVLRNYLDKSQTVELTFKPENWLTLLSPARKRAEVKPNDATRETFNFRAVASVKDGRQRVTAVGTNASDAIEKSVSVHPDGEEVAQTAAQVFGETGQLEITVPGDAIKGTPRAELKIYPNLMAHVLEGIEGILQRPYGCGEQTISSTYPNVMTLRYIKTLNQPPSEAIAATAAKARKYAVAGYERLLGYRAPGGGFTYWGRGEADLSLTAYALRFLSDASEVITIDEKIIAETRDWLIKQQQADGHWLPESYWRGDEQTRAATVRTAQITRSLAAVKGKFKSDDKAQGSANAALTRALDYLAKRMPAYDEPYAIASFALAAIDAGEKERVARALEKLRSLARDEAGGAYWNLETNTPFYGWGMAGRVETSALALKALALGGAESDRELIGRGLYFVLKNKDRYGVWYSTQATINVHDALITLFAADAAKAGAGNSMAEVLVNGRRVTAITLPPASQLSSPINIGLSAHLTTGANRVEVKRAAGAALATAQVVETHYVPWPKSAATQGENIKPGASRALRLAVKFDKAEVKIGEEINCRVEAERIGHYGYGMMLAEVGLPPGAEVDRESLEKAVKEAGWGVDHYDVLPDHVILYLWPRAGGVKFDFKFKLRFGTKAQSAASILYDYYNPEARAVVSPVKFMAK